ncbi:hypothetical protein ACKX2L_01570 [Lachnospiraceae bacterium YH-ros2228]
MKDRGLKDLLMITLDAHEGIQDAISKVFLNLHTNLDLTKK